MTADQHMTDLETRAACLVNPASGIANDYLNVFNEVLLLIENLPILLPEMIADLEQWRPQTYQEYFSKSPLPGSDKALAVYETLDPDLRECFEMKIAEVAAIANEGKAIVRAAQERSGVVEPDDISDSCGALAAKLRERLMEATDIVNNGLHTRAPQAQVLADRLMKLSA